MSKSNQRYWAEREEKNIRNRIHDDEIMKKKLTKLYQDALKEIEATINDFYVKYATNRGITVKEAQKRVSKMDVVKFSEKAKEYVKNKDFSDKANEELALYNLKMKINRLELLSEELNLLLCDLYNDTEKYLYEQFNKAAYEEVQRQAGLLGNSVQLTAEQLSVVVDNYFDVGDFSDNIWANKRRLLDKLNQTINRSITRGENPRKLAGQFAKEMNSSLASALRILRTEIGRVQIAQQKQNYEEYDIKYYQIITEPTACAKCKEFGNSHETIDDAPKYKVSDLMVGINAPVFHPNCRCSTIPVVDYPKKDNK